MLRSLWWRSIIDLLSFSSGPLPRAVVMFRGSPTARPERRLCGGVLKMAPRRHLSSFLLSVPSRKQ